MINEEETINMTPLIRGLLTQDQEMPVCLKMSVPLAKLLVSLLRESRQKGHTALFLDCLEQVIALQHERTMTTSADNEDPIHND